MNAGQVAAWVDAEFLGQHASAGREYLQRIALPPASVQRDHQQAAHPFPQRVIRHHGGQVRHDFLVLAQREQDVGTFFRGHRPQLAQARPLSFREGPGHPGERDAPPQAQRRVQRVHRAGRISALTQPTGPGQMLLEGNGVRLARHQVEHIASPRGNKHPARPAQRPVRFDDAAQTRDIGVNAALGAGRRILPPDRVDKLAAGDDPVRPHREDAEDGLLPGLPDSQLLVAVPGRYGAEHADTQHHGLADLPLAGPTHPNVRPPAAERLY